MPVAKVNTHTYIYRKRERRIQRFVLHAETTDGTRSKSWNTWKGTRTGDGIRGLWLSIVGRGGEGRDAVDFEHKQRKIMKLIDARTLSAVKAVRMSGIL
jgi:hypothetical protein